MINVSCAIIIDGMKNVLVAQRSGVMPLPFKWEFPGGKVEQGESAELSIVREIKEELSVSIRITGRLRPNEHAYGSKVIRLIPFLCEIIEGEINLKEHLTYKWLSISDLNSLDWAEADVPIMKELVKLDLDRAGGGRK